MMGTNPICQVKCLSTFSKCPFQQWREQLKMGLKKENISAGASEYGRIGGNCENTKKSHKYCDLIVKNSENNNIIFYQKGQTIIRFPPPPPHLTTLENN